MTPPTTLWQQDVELLLRWTDRDERALKRVRAGLSEDERGLLDAVVASRGDPKTLAEQLGPIVRAKLEARGIHPPARLREPAARAWKALRVPLKLAWRPPVRPDPSELAQAFADRYAARLEELTDAGAAAVEGVNALAGTLRTAGGLKELGGLLVDLQSRIAGMQAAATRCSHTSPDRAGWLNDASDLAREATDTLALVHRLEASVKGLHGQLEGLAASLREWADAPPPRRAATAEAMAVRVRAARDVALGLRDEFTALVLGRP